MYQAYVIQMIGDNPVNMILGDNFRTIDAAYRAVTTYEQNFGKCDRAVIEPAGTEIPVSEAKKKTVKEQLLKLIG